MERAVVRKLPDGSVRRVQPFHVSLEGLETAIICRDQEDYDAVEKQLVTCARRKNVLIVIHAVVSNHAHAAILAVDLDCANAYAQDVKKMIGMWVRRKYGDAKLMKDVDASAVGLDSNQHVRNALAYIPRNALDNGCNVNEYPWTGYRAMFRRGDAGVEGARRVASLTKREKAALMHTCDNLADVPWLLDSEGHLIPSSFCDTAYLEQVFHGDQAFFIRTIGSLNSPEMRYALIEQPRIRLPDSEFHKVVNDMCQRWYRQDIAVIPMDKKIRLLTYVRRTMRTTLPQLARIFGLPREQVAEILRQLRR